jgi:hypothetical protein
VPNVHILRVPSKAVTRTGNYAVLVATGEYADEALRRLRAPSQDARRLAGVLRDPLIGGFDGVTILENRPHYTIHEQIEGVLADRSPNDFVLLYFSCHGLRDAWGRLHFASTNTNRNRLASTAVSAAFVNEQVERSRAQRKVLLLDCCFSGSFSAGFKGAPPEKFKVIDELASRGYVIITASDALEYAFEGEELTWDEPRVSIFTDAIVKGLATGVADIDGDGWISTTDLYNYVYSTVPERADQRPMYFANQVSGEIVIARAKAATQQNKRVSLLTQGAMRGEADATDDSLKLRQGLLDPLLKFARVDMGPGRSELSWTVEEAIRRAGPSSTADPSRVLALCWDLLPAITAANDWRASRVFALCMGLALHHLADSGSETRVLRSIFDLADISDRAYVPLAIAATKSPQAAASMGAENIKRLLSTAHPQVQWQMARRLSTLGPVLSVDLLAGSVIEASQTWSRRRLLSSAALELTSNRRKAYTLEVLLHQLVATEAVQDDYRFLASLATWLIRSGNEGVMDLWSSDVLRKVTAEINENEGLRTIARNPMRLEQAYDSPTVARAMMEMINYDLDWKSNGTSNFAVKDPGANKGRGRYSEIDGVTAFALANTSLSARAELQSELLCSYDEGIRWAVASNLPLLATHDRTSSTELVAVAAKLLGDENLWVIRETLTSLARLGPIEGDGHIRALSLAAVSALSRAEKQGWSRVEIYPAFAGFLARFPSAAKWIRVDLADKNG